MVTALPKKKTLPAVQRRGSGNGRHALLTLTMLRPRQGPLTGTVERASPRTRARFLWASSRQIGRAQLMVVHHKWPTGWRARDWGSSAFHQQIGARRRPRNRGAPSFLAVLRL